ncbi:MAG TPA: DUF1772 domain-containing protein [Bacillota bacterium]|nr:DUF1772 domain-containing protein [Bacillota bacterium]
MNQTHYKSLLLITLVVSATVLGILALYSHTIMPGLRKVDDPTFVKSFQAIDRQIINPIFMLQFFAPLFLLAAVSYYAYKHHLVEAKYIYVAFACYLAAVVITVAVNVPLNDGIKKVGSVASGDAATTARAQFQEAKWLFFNHARTLLTLISVCCTSAAVWVSKAL